MSNLSSLEAFIDSHYLTQCDNMAQSQSSGENDKEKSFSILKYFRSTPKAGAENKRKKFDMSVNSDLSVGDDEFPMTIRDLKEVFTKKLDLLGDKMGSFLNDFREENTKKWDKMEKHLTEIGQSLEAHEKENSELKKENEELRKHVNIMEGRLSRTEKQVEDLREDALQSTARSMRNNVVFTRIAETQGENLVNVLDHFLETEMRISKADINKISYHRVHRMGKKGSNPRPIVAVLNDPGVTIVMKSTSKLAGKPFGVNIQIPRELFERRKQLMPLYKTSKQQKKSTSWSSDKLYVDNKEHKVSRDTVRDVNLNITGAAMATKVCRAPPCVLDGSCFQGSRIQITKLDDVIPGLHAVYSDARVARATHNSYAYRLETSSGVTEHYEDDGEHGAGEHILKVLRAADVKNKLIVVTRWYGGAHLGPKRFQLVEEATTSALNM